MSDVHRLGDQLVAIVGSAHQEVLLAAPYIKRATFKRLLAAFDPSCAIRVVTRWRIDEIALGVSDLEIWEELRNCSNSELWLQPSLHAKYYRADDRVAFGSANLTDSALGWGPSPNLEILHEVENGYADRRSFERALFSGAVKVDAELYKSFVAALEAFPPTTSQPSVPDPLEDVPREGEWRPSVRFPKDLFMLYAGDGSSLSSAAREAAANDLAALRPPSGLSEAQFNRWIELALLQEPEFRAIYNFVTDSRRFGEMRGLLSDRGAADGSHAWQTWMRWIAHFMPGRLLFHTANYSEIVSRPRSNPGWGLKGDQSVSSASGGVGAGSAGE